MRYLGLILDNYWHFSPHFEGLARRVEGAAAALGRLLLNLDRPRTGSVASTLE